MSDSVRLHRWQPTRLPHPWDSPGKNTGVGCHFLLQCMKGKSESKVTQSCPTLSNPMDCSLSGSSVHGIFQTRVLEWGAIAFSVTLALRLSLNSSVKVGILLLLLTIEKSFFSPLSKMLGLSFLEMTFVRLKKVSSTLCCFYHITKVLNYVK